MNLEYKCIGEAFLLVTVESSNAKMGLGYAEWDCTPSALSKE